MNFTEHYLNESISKETLDKLNIQYRIIDGEVYVVLYHGTTKKNWNSILKNGFKVNSYFSPDMEIAKRFGQMLGTKSVVSLVYVNLDSLDFTGDYFYANKQLNTVGGSGSIIYK